MCDHLTLDLGEPAVHASLYAFSELGYSTKLRESAALQQMITTLLPKFVTASGKGEGKC